MSAESLPPWDWDGRIPLRNDMRDIVKEVAELQRKYCFHPVLSAYPGYSGKSRRCQMMPPATAATMSITASTIMSLTGQDVLLKILELLTYQNGVNGPSSFIGDHHAATIDTK
jgi:hypothetical protein